MVHYLLRVNFLQELWNQPVDVSGHEQTILIPKRARMFDALSHPKWGSTASEVNFFIAGDVENSQVEKK